MPLQPDSHFARAYEKGISKKEYWDPVYEDSMNLIAKLPGIAALIYRNTYFGGNTIPHDRNLDWAANLAHQMGESACNDSCTASNDLIRLFSLKPAAIKGLQISLNSDCAYHA